MLQLLFGIDPADHLPGPKNLKRHQLAKEHADCVGSLVVGTLGSCEAVTTQLDEGHQLKLDEEDEEKVLGEQNE